MSLYCSICLCHSPCPVWNVLCGKLTIDSIGLCQIPSFEFAPFRFDAAVRNYTLVAWGIDEAHWAHGTRRPGPSAPPPPATEFQSPSQMYKPSYMPTDDVPVTQPTTLKHRRNTRDRNVVT